MKYLKLLSVLLLAFLLLNNSVFKKRKEVIILTNYGNIVLELYNETPKHRDNFIKLIKDSIYKDLLFHRVIKNFMIQGGDPDSRFAKPGQLLGEGGLDYTVPSEFRSDIFHKRGSLAAARESDLTNPLKASSSTQFYIVQGKKFNTRDLDLLEEKINRAKLLNKLREINATTREDTIKARKYVSKHKFRFSSSQRRTYMKEGGTPHLDQNYTVFGEVKEGMEVVDKIANLQTDSNDRPLQDIRFTIITKN